MASRIDTANDVVQTLPTRTECTAYLKTLTTEVLRGVADLNYVDTEGSRAELVRAIADDRWPR